MEWSRAYSLPVPLRYLTAVGAVTVQWGYFDSLFESFVKLIARPPETLPMVAKMPKSFQRR